MDVNASVQEICRNIQILVKRNLISRRNCQWPLTHFWSRKQIRLIDLFRLSILFSQYRSCDDTQESIFFLSWTFSCSQAIFLMNTTKVQTSYRYRHMIFVGKPKSSRGKGPLGWDLSLQCFLCDKKKEITLISSFAFCLKLRIITIIFFFKKQNGTKVFALSLVISQNVCFS